jgi:hypothetical protein
MQNTSDMLSDASKQVEKDVNFLTSAKTWKNLTQNQIISGLTVVLLVVGVVTGVYLGQGGQDVRQQASNAYRDCTAGSALSCEGKASGAGCTFNDGSGDRIGLCVNSETNGQCQCLSATICRNDGELLGSAPGCCSGASHQASNGQTVCGNTPIPDGVCYPVFPDAENDGWYCANSSNALPAPDHMNCSSGLACGNQCIQPGECFNTGNQCCDGSTPIFDPTCHSTESRCPVPATGIPTRAPTSVPTGNPTTVPPNPCLNTTEEVTTACGVNGCGSCDQSVTLRGSDGITHCGHICRQNPSCPGCTGVTPPLATNTPALTLSPTNTPVIGPVCLNVTMNNPATTTAGTPPSIGHVVTLSCSPVTGATRYEFRVRQPDNTLFEVNPSVSVITTSEAFQISMAGNYAVECRACATTDDSSCSPWQSGL